MKESLETLLTQVSPHLLPLSASLPLCSNYYFQRYQSLRTLILNNNKIGDKGCPLITAFISGCTTLTRVDIVNIGVLHLISFPTSPYFYFVCSLLFLNFLQFKDEGLDSICNSIKFSNSYVLQPFLPLPTLPSSFVTSSSRAPLTSMQITSA